MGAQFRYSRTVPVAPFVTDDDPNTTTPGRADIFMLQARPPSGNILTTSNTLYLEFKDAAGDHVAGPTADLQVWFRDQTAIPPGIWTNAEPLLAAGHLEAYLTNDIRDAELFVQFLAVASVGTATTVTVHITES